ncbi:nucleotidyltransferase domain-containing protein [Acidobacteria bacterium AH-259-A15]|nr:nucleotidyltransferase domain-containing protein [Acidobacteria bacterium AH-259-A15]
MPVRSLSSSVLKWPDVQTVVQAVRQWSEKTEAQRGDLIRIGYFGSYARGDWGVGSDLDLVIVVESSDQPFERRAAQWDATELPVPADVLVYTKEEWQSLSRQGRFYPTLMQEAVWTYVRKD